MSDSHPEWRAPHGRRLAAKAFAAVFALAAGFVRAAPDLPVPAGKWTFECGEVVKLENAAIANDPAKGMCLRLVSSSSKATADAPAGIPDLLSTAAPFTVMLWLKPDKDMLSDFEVAMARQMGQRATKFASAMHDGEWHHIAVSYDPKRKGREYAVYLDWPDGKSPWRFFSFRPKSKGLSQCVIPVSFSKTKVTFGGKAGMSSYSVPYKGLVDDVAIYRECLSGGNIAKVAGTPAAPSKR